MSFSRTIKLIYVASFANGFVVPPQRQSIIPSSSSLQDYSKPNVEDTENYRTFEQLSKSFTTTMKASNEKRKKVAVIGGGLSGLACAKYLADAGHIPLVYEAR